MAGRRPLCQEDRVCGVGVSSGAKRRSAGLYVRKATAPWSIVGGGRVFHAADKQDVSGLHITDQIEERMIGNERNRSNGHILLPRGGVPHGDGGDRRGFRAALTEVHEDALYHVRQVKPRPRERGDAGEVRQLW